jgi:hypothetical protein
MQEGKQHTADKPQDGVEHDRLREFPPRLGKNNENIPHFVVSCGKGERERRGQSKSGQSVSRPISHVQNEPVVHILDNLTRSASFSTLSRTISALAASRSAERAERRSALVDISDLASGRSSVNPSLASSAIP